jgi:hypothetical protein
MNHQPFRDWLVSAGELSVEQEQALKDHLLTCTSCREIETSLKELEVEIKRSPVLDPAPGFVMRWQAHLAEQHHKQQRLRGWLMIAGIASVVLALLALVIYQLWALIEAPDAFLAAWFANVIDVISIFFTLQNLVTSFSLPTPVYTIAGMALLFGLVSFMSVLWLATYRKFSIARRHT